MSDVDLSLAIERREHIHYALLVMYRNQFDLYQPQKVILTSPSRDIAIDKKSRL